MSVHDVEVITYGGGDVLRMVFNAIAMMFYGDSRNSIVQPLCLITAMIGGSWGLSKCFFQSYTDAFLTKYFLPLLAVPAILIIPQTSVHIIDKLNDKPIVVDHVPLLVAKIAGMSSYWSHTITEAIERVMHTPSDVKYSQTGMIFGSDTTLDFSRMKLNDATLAQNLNHFTQQCVIYDIALGRYTLDDLRKSSDLLDFLKKRTSKVRMIPYLDPKDGKREFLTCQETVEAISPYFEKEVKYYLKHEVLKNLPVAYQALTSFKNNAESRIGNFAVDAAFSDIDTIAKNIIVVNAFDEASSRFAVERAKDSQRSVYQTAGAMAGGSLVTLKIVLEALIYACCILIIPLSLLPGGVKFLTSWVFLNVWIQLWPPLYGIINYITMLCAKKYAVSVMGGLSNGFSLFTSAGFQDLAFDTAALGGYLSLSVPILSFYLLQNFKSLAHLSGSLMSPIQSAISTAAAEQSSGNYSYANTSIGQTSYDNQTSFQSNTAPTLSSGFFTDNYGTHQVKYGSSMLTVNQDPSHLNTSISIADAYTDSLQNAKHNAQSQVETTQSMFSETRGTAERSIADLVQHVSSSDMFSQGYSSNSTKALQESANFVTNAAESWGLQHGLSGRESLEYFGSVGIDCSFIGSVKGGHSQNHSVMSDEARQSAENMFKSKDFQEHYQNVLNLSANESTSSMTDEGRRFVENYASSMEQLKSTQDQFSTAQSDLNQISENLSYVESHSSTVNANLNTEFANWLSDRDGLGALFDRSREGELNSLRDVFISEKCRSDIGELSNFKEPGYPTKNMPNLEEDWTGLKERAESKASGMNLEFGNMLQARENIQSQYDVMDDKILHKFSTQHQELTNNHNSLKSDFESQQKEGGFPRLNNRIDSKMKAEVDRFHDNVSGFWFDNYAKPE